MNENREIIYPNKANHFSLEMFRVTADSRQRRAHRYSRLP
jgi:hypothetical protein